LNAWACSPSGRTSLLPSRPISPPLSLPHSEQARWFAEEVQPYEPPLRSYLRRTLPSAADVDDTVQDCYVRLIRAKQNGQVRSAKPLLFAIARNAVHDFFSRRSRVDLVPLAEEEDLPVLENGGGLVESICHQQELTLLAEAIQSLPDRCREVMLLRKVKGMSQRDIAELLGISEHTVETQVVRGARRCAEFLRAKGVNGEARP
jgi:RNA polymerase sigma factor (sigma-70 family)